ncbi:MAG: hypothetical protein KKF48_02890 [Nanoarchaeota archaeon]|nr:hypothetical protein [Nanoarchaeota archaeon]MBU1027969.1 hypothetical protein [Nanoarchaeota archaeon]
MPQSSTALLHHHKRKRKKNISRKKLISWVDKAIYFAGAIALIMTIPQVLKIWIDQNPAGVSLTTWGTYFILHFFWISYAVLHKAKPLIIVYSAGLLINALIVVGLILYG